MTRTLDELVDAAIDALKNHHDLEVSMPEYSQLVKAGPGSVPVLDGPSTWDIMVASKIPRHLHGLTVKVRIVRMQKNG